VKPARLLEHGLWNCATLVGFVYATRRYLVLPENERKKRARFVGVFIILFLVFVTAAAIAFEPSFAALLPVSPLIIAMVIFSGLFDCAEALFSTFTGHAAYLPYDKPVLGIMTLVGLALAAMICVYVAHRIVRYLND